ncbi:MAG: filamentous hemagglutinin family protein [Sphingobium sp.]|uniref:filamentous haemagglutinin family protein n=1 Tax=Sphingobium sp. TaxID=1912891 RepID=UPI003BB0731C
MTSNRNTRTKLLIGASLSAMLLTGVAAQAQSEGGWSRGSRGGTSYPAAAAARAAQDQAVRQAQTNSATQRALDAFRRQAQTRTQMQDAQLQARIAAQAINNIPNGLKPGGLQQAPEIAIDPSLWVGADRTIAETQGTDGRTQVTVAQTDQKAILTWDSFNVGTKTDLTFKQNSSDWVVLNRVRDVNPSLIHGGINAKGTVLILNQNGILFGGASTVNVRNLVASSANITNTDFLNRGIYSRLVDSNYLPSFTGAGGAITVEAGAQIKTHAPESVTAGGGYVMLLGTAVSNAGSITTAKGQTLLSAGDDFIIRRGYGTEENKYSTTRGNEVRGLITEGSTSGTVINSGLIEAAQGDITLGGRTIRQDGVLLSTTGVNQRGTIHLLNSASDTEGSVTLGKDSLTIILPELDSKDTALDAQRDALIKESATANINRLTTTNGGFDDRSLMSDRLDQSRVEIVTGGDVLFEGGSQTSAQGGQVAVQANNGRITVADGARIDVSGVMGVALDMESNSILVNVQGNELRDSPANRDNDRLKSQDIWIDVRDLVLLPSGTGGYESDRWYTKGGLLEVGGWLGNTAHGIGEWTAVGGTITLAAKEVIAHKGATFDISGGSLDYAAGWVNSTRVLGEDGKLYDVGSAPAGMKMLAWGDAFVRKHERWGEAYTQVWSNPLGGARSSRRWSDGYSVGRDAGTLILSAPTIVMDGDILAEAFNGERQSVGRADSSADGYKLGQDQVARAGALTIGNVNAIGFDTPLVSRVVVGSFPAIDGEAGAPLPADQEGTVLLDADLVNGYGLGALTIVSGDSITIEKTLTLADGGALNLVASEVAVDADITIRGGTVTATNRAMVAAPGSTEKSSVILFRDGKANFDLGSGATIDLAGVWSNERRDGRNALSLAHVDGGALSVRMVEGSVRLAEGSVVDLSSGAALLADGTIVGGRGGDLTLVANEARAGLVSNPVGTDLVLNGIIHAQGVVGGGKLTLQSPSPVLFGENAVLESGVLEAGVELPADVVLAEAITLPAGATLPFDVTVEFSDLKPGVPAPQPLGMSQAVVIEADWTVPGGIFRVRVNDSQNVFPGGVIPAGSTIFIQGSIAQGIVLPADAFPHGIPVLPYSAEIKAGQIAPVDVAVAAGRVLARGSRFDQPIQFTAATRLDAGLLNSGFSDYDVTSHAGLVVSPGVELTVETPVLRPTVGTFAAASNLPARSIMESWTPPAFMENPETGRFDQRPGASLSLRGTSLELGTGARISVDPGQSVRLVAAQQMVVDGTIVAPGGDIALLSEPVGTINAVAGNLPGQSIWVGENARLDAAGRAWTARDTLGRRYGVAQDGGAIRIGLEDYARVGGDLLDASRAMVIIREGAVLDASGASATIDVTSGSPSLSREISLVGDGGLIQIGSMTGIVNDGTMRAAAGGQGAAGGRLNLVLENDRLAARAVRTLTITKAHVASGLAADAAPGTTLPESLVGTARISAEDIEAGGFGSLDLWSRDVFEFDGNVDLSMRESLALRRGLLSVSQATPQARVTLAAPHVLLAGKVAVIGGPGEDGLPPPPMAGLISASTHGNGYSGYGPSSSNAAQLAIKADLIDVTDDVFFGGSGNAYLPDAQGQLVLTEVDRFGFDHVEISSRGDIRFTDGLLWTAGNMTLTAGQIYPSTHARGEIYAGIDNPNQDQFDDARWLKIRGNGTTPGMPFSVFGELYLRAPTIDQGGIVRAPLGRIVFGNTPNIYAPSGPFQYDVVLREGSLTSTSAAGLRMPYGGTADGLKYFFDGAEVNFDDLAELGDEGIEMGVQTGQARVTSEVGSVIDVSGGGELTGAGFFTGRGGSLDVLRTALANISPAYSFSSPDAEVYAIVPSMNGDYAPISPDTGAAAPRIGQQITITEAVPGLPAGTYTLMPSTYALLPGAFRVELGGTSSRELSAIGMPSGMLQATGYLGTANTGVRDALPTRLSLMSAKDVRSFSQYNETGYAAFAIANAARFGSPTPRLERDAQNLQLDFGTWQGDLLDLKGEVRMAGADNGADGNLFLTAAGSIEIKARGTDATDGFTSVDSEDLALIEAGILTVGGIFSLRDGQAAPELGGYALGPRVVFQAGQGEVVVRDGARLAAGQIFLTSRDRVTVDGGALIEAVVTGGRAIDAAHGYIFSDTLNLRSSTGGAILGVSSGDVRFTAPTVSQDSSSVPTTAISIADGAILRTPGSILFSTNGELALGEAELNARYLTLTSPGIHIGTAESFARADAAGVLGSGVRLSQTLLERLVTPTVPGQTPIERLTLNAGSSINMLGEVALDLVGTDTQLLLETPALYGWGEEGDTARIAAGTVIWSGVATGAGAPTSPYTSLLPGAVTPGGPGTGHGTLSIDAKRIEFGYASYAQPQDQVELDRLALGFSTVNLLASEHITANHRGSLSVFASGTDAESYSGGDLNIVTPVLTGSEGSFARYRAGGEVAVTAPAGASAPDLSTFNTLGAEVRLAGENVRVDTAVVLPSGRLVLDAQSGITLGDRAAIDLSGRTIQLFDVTRHSWGGDLVMETATGAIDQTAGSIIDVSAASNDAGTIQATAMGTHGAVRLAGTLRGSASGDYFSGAINVRARSLDDFTALNERLNVGGFFEARGFVVGTGDLVIGDEVRARRVSISADGGSLTVNGRIDASGARPGEIRLAARDDLVLANGAVLDVRSTQLQIDGRGAAIEAANRGHVELTTTLGSISLASGAIIDMGSVDNVARGRLEINAPRIGGNDVAVDAAAGLAIRGAESVAVNAFRSYTPEDGRINQGYLDIIHGDSIAFIDAALANDAVAGRLAGLTAYGDAFHLRPGVDIRSATPDGNLVVDGDIDLSGYRYGPGVDPALRGSGEPGVVTIRAGGDLKIEGSITDGFAPPPATPDDPFFDRVPGETVTVPGGTTRPDNWLIEADLTVLEDWVVPDTPFYQNFEGYIYDTSWNYYGPGQTIPAGTTLIAGNTILEANTPLPSYASVTPDTYEPGRVWAAAPMLAPGSRSWSMRLVSGADLASADSRTLAAASHLADRGNMILDVTGKIGAQRQITPISVIRTGTGNLELLAGGSYIQRSLFGVYTAGTQIDDGAAWDVGRVRQADGTVLGWGNEAYEATLDPRRMFMTRGGGDLRLTAQGDVRGYIEHVAFTTDTSADIGQWLWRQGGDGPDQPVAWGINFGQYNSNLFDFTLEFSGFAGMGTLGGGNVTIEAGGDVGSTANLLEFDAQTMTDGLAIAIGSSGRIDASGRLLQEGGGNLTLTAGGRINTGLNNRRANPDSSGMITNLRGEIDVRAGAIGQTQVTGYGVSSNGDPRPVDVTRSSDIIAYSPLVVSLGDAQARITARGNLAVTNGRDPGRTALIGGQTAAGDGSMTGTTAFTLWTDRSGVDLFSAGGDIVWSSIAQSGASLPTYSPGRFTAVATGGSIIIRDELMLAPSRQGALELLSRDHVIGGVYGRVAMSGAAQDRIATPFNPLWLLDGPDGRTSNAFLEFGHLDGSLYDGANGAILFAFAPDTAGDLPMDSTDPIRLYALTGDVNIRSGRVHFDPQNIETYWIVSRPTQVRAGRDILGSSHLMLNRNANDISVVRAGRDILNSSFRIGGPGLLDVAAGRSIYQAYTEGGSVFPAQRDQNIGVFQSLGALVPGDIRLGADIVLSAGLGSKGPDLESFAARYLDPANLADPERPLADQPGKVVKTYERELRDWLRSRYGFDGGQEGAVAQFGALSVEERGIFLRSVYYEELRLAGREYNNPDSRRFGSYLRGRDAIASFLPGMGEGDEQGDYQGSITFLEAAGAHTYAGGDIQVLAPGGGLILGADGVAPPPTSGLLTQGRGDIEVFTRESVLLGLSRVFTTFGGGITMWSAEGDINAGRGSKTSLVYTPPRRIYDSYGNVALSPQTPSSGAGIATLNPIPEVAPGDIDLIAPLGTIDAGEAGIRVSGNINLAALQVLNAANIKVQGEAAGIPVVAAVNTGALTAASSSASAVANQAAQLAERARPQVRTEIPVIVQVRLLGFGENP